MIFTCFVGGNNVFDNSLQTLVNAPPLKKKQRKKKTKKQTRITVIPVDADLFIY